MKVLIYLIRLILGIPVAIVAYLFACLSEFFGCLEKIFYKIAVKCNNLINFITDITRI